VELGLNSKTALVLGGGGGLGAAIAAALGREGAKVAVADLDLKGLGRSAAAVRATGAEVIELQWDLADLSVIDSKIIEIEQQFGPVDILMANTGGPPPTTAAGQSPDLWLRNFQMMVLSVIAIADRVLPGMKVRRWGRIITGTSSGVVSPNSQPCDFKRFATVAGRVVENSGA
jgi:3-oxoacyl-[acyl-carrier protein] reductase